MNKISRVIVSALLSLAAALTAAVALSAPAEAMTVAPNTNTNTSMQAVSVTIDDDDMAKVKMSGQWAAEALCADIVTSSSSWFDWSVPEPNGSSGADRCAGDLVACAQAGARYVTFLNYAGPVGWQWWGDTCSVR